MRVADTRLRRTGIRPTRLTTARGRGGEGPGPVTFPTTHLQFRVMIALGADLTASWLTWQWEDITRFVRYDVGISTRTGRPDQSTVVTPGRTVLKLDNRDGRFSRRNPTGPYYGLLSKNTPLWVQVDAGSGYRTRVQHYVNEWPTRWDKSGNDCTVTIVASGVLRRMAHSTALGSPLRRAVLSGATPTAYWPLEDGADVTAGAPGIPGGQPMQALGPAVFGATGFGGATASVDLGGPASLGTAANTLGRLVGYIDGTATGEFRFEYVLNLGTDPFDTYSQVDIFSGPPGFSATTVGWSTGHNIGGHPTLLVQTFPAGSPNLVASASIAAVDLWDGEDHHIALDVTSNGTSADYVLTADGAYTASGTAAVGLATPVPALTQVQVNGFGSGFSTPPTTQAVYRVGSFVFYDAAGDPGGDHVAAMRAYAGEMAHERIERMCAVAGVTYASTGATARSQQLGPQPVATALQIIRDAESVDHGVVFESAFGLGYQGKQQRYNVPVGLALDFDQGHIAEAPQPADDDQGTANRVSVSRPGGSEATVEDSASVVAEGLYDDSETVNAYTDGQLVNMAGWHVHEGTIDEDRWPSLALNFLRQPGLIDTWTALPYGARLRVDNPPPEVAPDPIDAFVEGHSEWFTPLDWRAVVNTTPATVYEVYEVEGDGNRGRVDTAGSSLAADVSDVATSLSVISTGVIWVQGTVNFDLFIAGERITVTNITGAASPQTFTVTRSVNGVAKAQSAGAAVRLWRPGAVAL